MENDDLLALLAVCEGAVDDLRGWYDWDLLDRTSFVTRTMEVVQSSAMMVADRAAWYVYSAVVYNACSGREGKTRQERGYTELFRCLYRRLVHRYNDVDARETAQQTLVVIHHRFEECREPHAFFAFAFQCLWSEVRRIRRKRNHEASSGGEERWLPEVHAREPEPDDELVQRDQLKEWGRFLEEAKVILPRAAQQLEIVRLTYVVGLRDQEIAEVMGIRLISIPSRRSRGLRKLRENPALRDRGREMGLF